MMSKELTLYYQNCNGIKSKLIDLRLNVLNCTYDVIILTETWLRSDIGDPEIISENYTIFRRDRNLHLTNKSGGGGVLVAVKNTIEATRRVDLEAPNLEEIFVLLPKFNEGIILCACYIPPSSSKETYETHFYKLQDIHLKMANYTLAAVGDYNLPKFSWTYIDNLAPSEPKEADTEVGRLLSNTMSLLNFKQFNYVVNESNHILDLVFCNVNCKVSKTDYPLVNVDRHHPPLEVSVQYALPDTIRPAERRKRNFYKADYELINKALRGIDWIAQLNHLDVEASTQTFYNHIYKIIDDNIPVIKRKSPKYPIWFSRGLIRALREKKKVWKRWKTYSSIRDYQEFSLLRTRIKSLLIKCYKLYIEDVEASITNNSGIKQFWKYASSLKQNNTGYPRTMKLADTTSDNPDVICNMFSTYFESVFEPTAQNAYDTTSLDNLDSPTSSHINHIEVTEDEVSEILKNLDINKGAGPDMISPVFLKRTYTTLTVPLTLIFNKCLTEGYFPARWKEAHITPIHKSGPTDRIDNYRPISILSAIPKILEKLVHRYVYNAVQSNILAQQHGFVQGRSTITNLLLFSNFLFTSMDNKRQVDAIYTDFKKAFDKVDHLILLKKLSYNGIKGNLLRWFASYLQNRLQSIVINGYSTVHPISVTSGVPQGSILGPLLFVLFINDISSCFNHCNFLLYADDLKIFKQVTSQSDIFLIQQDLDRLDSYCKQNKISLAHSKCKHITFTRNHTVHYGQYSIDNQALGKVSFIGDLGVTFDSKLSFEAHIDRITNKANKMLGFVLRITKAFTRYKSILILFHTLVRSQLEYASVIWNPFYAVYKDRVEAVQRKFLRILNYRLHSPYSSYGSLLEKYNLLSLSDRRLMVDAVTLRSICVGEFKCPQLLSLVHFRTPIMSLRSGVLFALNVPKSNAGKRAPLYRLCDQYNKGAYHGDMFLDSRHRYKLNVKESIQSFS